MNVVETKTAPAPKTQPTTVVREDAHNWYVECEGGCYRVHAVPKITWRPVSYSGTNLDIQTMPMIEVRQTAPGARRCVLCGPFTQANR